MTDPIENWMMCHVRCLGIVITSTPLGRLCISTIYFDQMQKDGYVYEPAGSKSVVDSTSSCSCRSIDVLILRYQTLICKEY